jgi:hypothetical protein
MNMKLKWEQSGFDKGGDILVAGPFSIHRRGSVPQRQGYSIKSAYVVAIDAQRIGPAHSSAKDAKRAAQTLADAIVKNMEAK